MEWRSVYFIAPPVTTPTLPARVLDLGLRDFGAVWELQRELVAARQRDEIPDTLLLVEHPDVITLGRGTRRENLLRPDDMPVFEIERGGDVTYHGPGQLVGYPIFLLRQDERDLHRYLRNIEEALIQAIAELGLSTGRRAGWTGVWMLDPPSAQAGLDRGGGQTLGHPARLRPQRRHRPLALLRHQPLRPGGPGHGLALELPAPPGPDRRAARPGGPAARRHLRPHW